MKKNISIALVALSLLLALQNSTAKSLRQYISITYASNIEETQEMTPKIVTAQMVKTFGLNKNQAKKILKLNKKYSDVMALPRVLGRKYAPEIEKQIERDIVKQYLNAQAKKSCCPFKKKKQSAQETLHKNTNTTSELTAEETKIINAHLQKIQNRLKAYEEELSKIMTSEQFENYMKISRGNGVRYTKAVPIP